MVVWGRVRGGGGDGGGAVVPGERGCRGAWRPRLAGGIGAGRVDMGVEARQALQKWQDEGAGGGGGRRLAAAAAAAVVQCVFRV